jgi:hypothetical protein
MIERESPSLVSPAPEPVRIPSPAAHDDRVAPAPAVPGVRGAASSYEVLEPDTATVVATAEAPLVGSLVLALAFGSLATAGLGERTAALVLGGGAALLGLAFLVGPLRGRLGGYGLSGSLIGIAGCLLVALLAVTGLDGTAAATAGDAVAGPQPAEGQAPPVEQQPETPVATIPEVVVASGTAADSVDGAGDTVSFAATQLADGDPGTAWRVEGDGVGETVTFSWPAPIHVRRIGVVPGYAKQDAVSGEDRFLQNRRVRRATVTFDGGAAVQVDFTDSPVLQTFEVDAVTSTVQLTIESTTRRPDRDYAAMSEVQFWATA